MLGVIVMLDKMCGPFAIFSSICLLLDFFIFSVTFLHIFPAFFSSIISAEKIFLDKSWMVPLVDTINLCSSSSLSDKNQHSNIFLFC